MADPILVARGLWKSFGGRAGLLRSERPRRPALIDASLTLATGEILGVVGESGSGKTTLARALALLIRPDKGSVILGGEDLTLMSRRELSRRRRRIQTVFQDPYASLNPRLRIGDAIAEVLKVHRLASGSRVRGRVAELLDLVGLPATAAGRYPADFSGGQRQRICIARALAAEPEVLIADEPVSALDVSIRAQILNLLLDLKARLGLSMIFIGHDLFVVDFVSDRVAVMLGGQIVEVIPRSTGLDGAAHPYTRELMATAPTLDLDHEQPLPVETPAAGEVPVVGCPYWARCPIRADRCGIEYPSLVELGGGHHVASFCVAGAGRLGG